MFSVDIVSAMSACMSLGGCWILIVWTLDVGSLLLVVWTFAFGCMDVLFWLDVMLDFGYLYIR